MSLEHAARCAQLVDAIHEAGARLRHGQHWPLIAPAPDAALREQLLFSREYICGALGSCSTGEVESILRSIFFGDPESVVTSGLLREHTPVTQARLDAARAILAEGWSHPQATHAFVIAVLHASPYEMPLMPDLHACSELVVERYLIWLFQRPAFRRVGDDARYVHWLTGMLEWLRERILDPRLATRLGVLVRTTVQRLDIGMMIYSDVAIRDVLDARARLIETITAQSPTLRPTRPGGAPPRKGGDKIRLGFLIRTILKHPDPLAFCSQFEHFDLDRYEIVLYSQDLIDRQCTHDIPLYQRLFRIVSAIHTVNGLTVQEMADRIHADDLDIFVYSFAGHIGANMTECLVSAPLARLQVVMNSYVPIATGLPSFTHVATVRPTPAMRATLVGECREELAEIPRVLLSYLPARTEAPTRRISRELLGIPEHAPVFYNGGAADKIVPVLAQAWIRTLARVPGSVLVLAPFNPGWSGVNGNIVLQGLLDDLCAAEGVARSRIIVLRELSPRDTGQLQSMATVYFGTFPHGSSTSVALSLQAHVPVVARRSPWLRGTGDASLLDSIDLQELVADDADGYVDLAVRLATDRAYHADVVRRIGEALPTAPFLGSVAYGRGLQTMFDRLAHAALDFPLPIDAMMPTPPEPAYAVERDTVPLALLQPA
ncbi:MAG: hypothetical protein MUE41_13170 [Gemmatimonadaceae bacterium]|jgi:predicted O-linked N-acetylglucosamine transferase (SPINDLY family)|nr:hypothetical protein [Gemmatimonadaceae bacterium]